MKLNRMINRVTLVSIACIIFNLMDCLNQQTQIRKCCLTNQINKKIEPVVYKCKFYNLMTILSQFNNKFNI
jgi:hypothetical protein